MLPNEHAGQHLTSLQNHHIKEARSLLQRRGRQGQASVLLEGTRLLEEAVQADCRIEKVFYLAERVTADRERALLRELSVRTEQLFSVSKAILSALAQTEQPQGIIVQAELPRPSLVFHHRSRLLVIDRVQDPGNLGTLFRLASAFACEGLILLAGSASPFNDKVIRSSMGAVFHLPWLEMREDELIDELSALAIPLLVADAAGSEYLRDMDLRASWAMVIGNEGNGVTETLKQAADHLFSIPMPGRAESLNAASAGAIMLYEASRQQADG